MTNSGAKFKALGRLTRVKYPDNSFIASTYDDVGNRLTMEDSTGLWTFLYDAESQLISAKSPQAEAPSLYEYDNEGNRTKLTDPDGNTIDYTRDDASVGHSFFIVGSSLQSRDVAKYLRVTNEQWLSAV